MYLLNCCKLLHFSRLFSKVPKCNFSSSNKLIIERLDKRALLKLSGTETSNYLQSMITNDVLNFKSLPALYSLLLNAKGRILYDIILYKLGDDEYLVEYDATATKYLEKHLLMYRLRKDVKIKHLSNLSSWVIYNEDAEPIDLDSSKEIISILKTKYNVLAATEDSRIKELGIRVVTHQSSDLSVEIQSTMKLNFEKDSYRLLRYKLGIGEGVLDHPPGECMPFETNVDFLNGVSFTKGCYIGQEVTARSQHVFVIRRRLMPIVLQKLSSYPLFPPECPIINELNQNVGKLRSHKEQHGLAVLKFEDCAKAKFLKLKDFDVTLETSKPKWWPTNLKNNQL